MVGLAERFEFGPRGRFGHHGTDHGGGTRLGRQRERVRLKRERAVLVDGNLVRLDVPFLATQLAHDAGGSLILDAERTSHPFLAASIFHSPATVVKTARERHAVRAVGNLATLHRKAEVRASRVDGVVTALDLGHEDGSVGAVHDGPVVIGGWHGHCDGACDAGARSGGGVAEWRHARARAEARRGGEQDERRCPRWPGRHPGRSRPEQRL